MEVYSYYHFISFHFICWWTCAIPSVVWFTAEKRHWASGRLGNDLSDKKQMKAGNISGWKKNRKSLASWWLNQPIWKTYARQIGSVPQFSGWKKKYVNCHHPDRIVELSKNWIVRIQLTKYPHQIDPAEGPSSPAQDDPCCRSLTNWSLTHETSKKGSTQT